MDNNNIFNDSDDESVSSEEEFNEDELALLAEERINTLLEEDGHFQMVSSCSYTHVLVDYNGHTYLCEVHCSFEDDVGSGKKDLDDFYLGDYHIARKGDVEISKEEEEYNSDEEYNYQEYDSDEEKDSDEDK